MSRNRGSVARALRQQRATQSQMKIMYAVPTDPRSLRPPTGVDCIYNGGICKTHSILLPQVDRNWIITGMLLDETGQIIKQGKLAWAYNMVEASEHLAKMRQCAYMTNLHIVRP